MIRLQYLETVGGKQNKDVAPGTRYCTYQYYIYTLLFHFVWLAMRWMASCATRPGVLPPKGDVTVIY
jgi:hypothetical protein